MGDLLNKLIEALKSDEFKAYIAGGSEGLVQEVLSKGLGQIEDNFLKKFGVELGAKDFGLLGSVSYWNNIFREIMDINQELGIAGSLGKNLQSTFKSSLADAIELGATYKDVAKEYEAFTQELGRNRQFTSEEFVKLAEYRQVFGDTASKIFTTYNKLGVSIGETSRDIQKIGIASSKLGINYSKVVKELERNLGAINRLSFAKGRRGMEEMAKLAIQTRLSMEEATQFANKIWEGSIEGAIEMGSELQLLGGEMAALGDPFELFYLARNAPEELQKRIADATREVASFNRELGEVVIDPLGMSRLRELSKTTGISLDELSESARTMRKETELAGKFDFSLQGRGDFDELLTKVAGVAEFNKGMNDWVVNIGNTTKRISELTPEMIGQLDVVAETTGEDEVFRELIKSNESLDQTMQRLIDQFKLGVLSPTNYEEMFSVIRNFADTIKESLETGSLNFVKTLLQDLFRGSFENLMELVTPLSQGDFGTAMEVVGDRLWGAIEGLGNILMLGLQALMGTIMYAIEQLIVGLGNVFIGVGNAIVRAITFGTIDEAISPMQGRSFGEFMPDPADFMELIPESMRETVGRQMLGSGFMGRVTNIQPIGGETNNEMMDTGIRNALELQRQNMQNILTQQSQINQGGNVNMNVDGTVTVQTPEGEGRTLTPQEIEEVVNRVVNDIVRGRNINGGRNPD